MSLFFYSYEKLYEIEIRNTKADRILAYQALMKNRKLSLLKAFRSVNDTRNPDLKMAYLRKRALSQHFLWVDPESERLEKISEIHKTLKSKTARSKWVMLDFPPDQYLRRKRRNSHVKIKQERFLRAENLFIDFVSIPPLPLPPKKKL